MTKSDECNKCDLESNIRTKIDSQEILNHEFCEYYCQKCELMFDKKCNFKACHNRKLMIQSEECNKCDYKSSFRTKLAWHEKLGRELFNFVNTIVRNANYVDKKVQLYVMLDDITKGHSLETPVLNVILSYTIPVKIYSVVRESIDKCLFLWLDLWEMSSG